MNALRLASLLVLSSATLAAHAAIIDFEDVTGGSDNGIFTSYGSPVVSHGFSFATASPSSLDPASAGIYNYTGSIALYSNFANSTITMSKVGGGAFDLNGIDLANIYLNGNGGSTVTFLGTRADLSTVTQSFVVNPAIDALQSFAFTGFSDLVSVSWQQAPNYHQFDNIIVNASTVPGPMAAAPFALLALRRRRKA